MEAEIERQIAQLQSKLSTLRKRTTVPYKDTYSIIPEPDLFDIVDDSLCSDKPLITFVENIFFSEEYPNFHSIYVGDIARHTGYVYLKDKFVLMKSFTIKDGNPTLVDMITQDFIDLVNRYAINFPSRCEELGVINLIWDKVCTVSAQSELEYYLHTSKKSI